MKVGDYIILQVIRFKYFGSVIKNDGEIEGNVNLRIQVGLLEWRRTLGVLCDTKVPLKFKGKFYRIAMKPGMLGG